DHSGLEKRMLREAKVVVRAEIDAARRTEGSRKPGFSKRAQARGHAGLKSFGRGHGRSPCWLKRTISSRGRVAVTLTKRDPSCFRGAEVREQAPRCVRSRGSGRTSGGLVGRLATLARHGAERSRPADGREDHAAVLSRSGGRLFCHPPRPGWPAYFVRRFQR